MIWKKQHERIFSLFLTNSEHKFSDISKAIGLRTNLLNYYLRDFLKQGILQKEDDYYRVSGSAEYLIPFFQQLTGSERLKLPVVLVAIVKKDKVLLIKRDKRPYKGYWGLLGGKIRFNERLFDTAVRTAMNEAGLRIKCVSVCHVADEFLCESFVKHGWLLFLVKAQPLLNSEAKSALWFNLSSLPSKIIPSDKWLIEDCLSKSVSFSELVISEADGLVKNFHHKDLKTHARARLS
jgi:ADP-ribose pyrophosphatase YjhB (NUDIX family)